MNNPDYSYDVFLWNCSINYKSVGVGALLPSGTADVVTLVDVQGSGLIGSVSCGKNTKLIVYVDGQELFRMSNSPTSSKNRSLVFGVSSAGGTITWNSGGTVERSSVFSNFADYKESINTGYYSKCIKFNKSLKVTAYINDITADAAGSGNISYGLGGAAV